MKEYKNKINELDAHKKEIIKMVKSGCTQKEIAEKFGTWSATIGYWLRKRGIKPEVIKGEKKTSRKNVQAVYTDNLILILETVTIYAKPDIQGAAAQLTVTNM